MFMMMMMMMILDAHINAMLSVEGTLKARE